MEPMQKHYMDVITSDDIADFLDMYRGSGIGNIIKNQFLEVYQEDDQKAFSALGSFIEALIAYHNDASFSKEIKDDYVYHEIQQFLSDMSKVPEYNEFESYLLDKMSEMKNADLLRNQQS